EYPRPEAEAASQAANRRRQTDSATAAEGEHVDRDREEREQGRDQDRLDCPAANDASVEVEIRPGPLRQLQPRVERGEQLLGRAPELGEPRDSDVAREIADVRRRALAARRQRQRADAASDERRLLVEAEG